MSTRIGNRSLCLRDEQDSLMVHIKKVEIYGLKSFGHNNNVVNFKNGIVCVTGPNGSGKSSILDAIIFALGASGSLVATHERDFAV